MIRRKAIIAASTGAGVARQPATSAPSTSRLTAEQRADALLRQMTIDEKAMQLSSVFPLALFDTRGTNHSQLDALLKNGIEER